MEKHTVCILAAGLGSRMGKLTQYLPKALLEVGGNAAISRVIQSFAHDFRFVVATGHEAHLVAEYLSFSHPDREIVCLPVSPFCGPGAGPGKSVLSCASHLPGSFFLVCCDTLWNEPFTGFPTDRNWIGVCGVTDAEAPNYCNVSMDGNGRIAEFRDKEPVAEAGYQAFVGLAFILDRAPFFQGLSAAAAGGNGELQLAAGLQAVASERGLFGVPVQSWIDIGTEEKLLGYRKILGTPDFAKRGEEIYLSSAGVIKFFSDEEIVAHRLERAERLRGLVPAITSHTKHFYRYDFVPGSTFYERGSPEDFGRLLPWLERRLWKPVGGVSASAFQEVAQRFYLDKTLLRLKSHCAKSAGLEARIRNSIEGIGLRHATAMQFHGDLSLANILIQEESGEFLLLDWRQNFGGSTAFGDLGYDLAKLLVSIRIDFSKLASLGAWMGPIPRPKYFQAYEKQLLEYFDRKGIDRQRIEFIAALILLNMAGIHTSPLDKIFFQLGLEALPDHEKGCDASLCERIA